MARAMATRYGMEPSVGQASYIAERPRYLDVADLGQRRSEASEETSARIDRAVRELVDEAFARATKILKECASMHEESAQRLLDKETFVEEELAPIQGGGGGEPEGRAFGERVRPRAFRLALPGERWVGDRREG